MTQTAKGNDSSRIRIEWKIGEEIGHGEWRPSSHRTTLEDLCTEANGEHGQGSHRVVSEAAVEAQKTGRPNAAD
jgi:hypothetical protein